MVREATRDAVITGITIKEYHEQGHGPKGLVRWYKTTHNRDNVVVHPWEIDPTCQGDLKRAFSRPLIYAQAFEAPYVVRRVCGGDDVLVEDVQQVAFDMRPGVGSLTTIFEPIISIPGLGSYRSCRLEIVMTDSVNLQGVPSIHAKASIKAHVEKAPYGLRVPLEFVFAHETCKNAEGIFKSIRDVADSYLAAREQGCAPPPDCPWPFAEEGAAANSAADVAADSPAEVAAALLDTSSEWHDAMSDTEETFDYECESMGSPGRDSPHKSSPDDSSAESDCNEEPKTVESREAAELRMDPVSDSFNSVKRRGSRGLRSKLSLRPSSEVANQSVRATGKEILQKALTTLRSKRTARA